MNYKERFDRTALVQDLETEVTRLRDALTEVVGACRTKISMKEVARKALFPPKEVTSDQEV